eukprot:4081533-Alexandrium_andersonii.AAC.2
MRRPVRAHGATDQPCSPRATSKGRATAMPAGTDEAVKSMTVPETATRTHARTSVRVEQPSSRQ